MLQFCSRIAIVFENLQMHLAFDILVVETFMRNTDYNNNNNKHHFWGSQDSTRKVGYFLMEELETRSVLGVSQPGGANNTHMYRYNNIQQ